MKFGQTDQEEESDVSTMCRLVCKVAELERAAETSRAEHHAAIGRAPPARIRELEGERDELLGLVRRWVRSSVTPSSELDETSRAIVARIEKAAKEGK